MKYIELTSNAYNKDFKIAADNIAVMWYSIYDDTTVISLKHGFYKDQNTLKVNQTIEEIESMLRSIKNKILYIELTSNVYNTDFKIAADNIAAMWYSIYDDTTVISLKHGFYKDHNTFKVNQTIEEIEAMVR